MNRQHENKIEADPLVEAEGITLNDFWDAFLEFKLFIISLAVTTTVVAMVYANSITPTYLAKILVAPVQSQNTNSLDSLASSLGNLANIAGISFNQGSSEIYTTFAIFRSRQFIEQYINEKSLMPLLFADNWDEQNKAWKNGQAPSINDAHDTFKDMMTIFGPENNLVTVSFESSDPLVAAELANGSIQRLNQHMRNQTIQETEKSIYFLQQQLEQTSLVNAQQLLFNLIEEQTKNIMIANVRDEYVFKVIDAAIPPKSQYKPNVLQITVMGFTVSFVLGCLLAFFKNILGFNIIPFLKSNKSPNVSSQI